MLIKIRTITKHKGQGIVEYALLLAFVVGIAMMLQGVGLANAVKDTFDDVANLLKGENRYVTALKEWGHKTRAELATISNKDRIASDQEALINIGKAFIGLTAQEVKDLIKPNDTSYDTNYLKKGNEVLVFNYSDATNQDISTSILSDSRSPQAINWMQTDYGTVGEGGSLNYDTAKAFDNGTRYFYSDYMLEDKSAIKWGNDRSIRASFTFDSEGKVESARVRVNRGSSKEANTHYHELDVTVTKSGGKQTNPTKSGVY